MSGPLSHIRVLDLSRILAGPWAGQILADMGADVIKVERPESGDDSRAWGPPFLRKADGSETREAGYYLAANRGKRSITVSLETPEGQKIIRELAAKSDILLENFKVGTLERFGLSYQDLSALNPRLIYCSITGFGQDGPKSALPAYDFLIQAMGGLMSVTGERDGLPGGGPQKVGIPIVDLVTGVYGSVAVLGALAARERTGKGDYIDIGMLDVQVGLLSNQAMNYLMSGKTPIRTGTAHPNIQPQRIFDCRDGQMILVVGNDLQFAKLCKTIQRPELVDDERFKTNSARVRNEAVLTSLLQELLVQNDRAHWVDTFSQAGVPCGPINTIPEVFEDPQVRHREMLRYLPHPTAGKVPQVASPLRFRESALEMQRPPPLMGQHTEEILRELGHSTEKVAQLRAARII
jgi:crotonobetainyl-CoA:carnitine CoA-transferase CaiB-like acyl-CoA transferase